MRRSARGRARRKGRARSAQGGGRRCPAGPQGSLPSSRRAQDPHAPTLFRTHGSAWQLGSSALTIRGRVDPPAVGPHEAESGCDQLESQAAACARDRPAAPLERPNRSRSRPWTASKPGRGIYRYPPPQRPAREHRRGASSRRTRRSTRRTPAHSGARRPGSRGRCRNDRTRRIHRAAVSEAEVPSPTSPRSGQHACRRSATRRRAGGRVGARCARACISRARIGVVGERGSRASGLPQRPLRAGGASPRSCCRFHPRPRLASLAPPGVSPPPAPRTERLSRRERAADARAALGPRTATAREEGTRTGVLAAARHCCHEGPVD